MVSEVLQNKWVRAVGTLGALILVAIVLYLLGPVLVPLFFAFIVAYIFDPVIDKIETYKISRVSAIVTLVTGILLVAILLPIIIIPSIIQQASEMVKPPVSAVGTAESDTMKIRAARKLEDWLALDTLVRTLEWVEPDETGQLPAEINSIGVIRRKIGEGVSENVETLVRSLFPKWQEAGSSILLMLSVIGDAFLKFFLFVGNFVLFAFVAIYLLKDYDRIVATGDKLVPVRYRPKMRDIMARVDRQLRAFLRGQFTVCVCLGAMYAIGFLISGAPFALLLALFGGLASFVPYLGVILTIGPAVILTILYFGGIDWHVLGVLITFAAAQFLEGNFLTPRIVGSQVGLNPVWVILAILVFSSALGFVGLLLAVPIAAVLKVVAEEVLLHYRRSTFFSDDARDSSPTS